MLTHDGEICSRRTVQVLQVVMSSHRAAVCSVNQPNTDKTRNRAIEYSPWGPKLIQTSFPCFLNTQPRNMLHGYLNRLSDALFCGRACSSWSWLQRHLRFSSCLRHMKLTKCIRVASACSVVWGSVNVIGQEFPQVRHWKTYCIFARRWRLMWVWADPGWSCVGCQRCHEVIRRSIVHYLAREFQFQFQN